MEITAAAITNIGTLERVFDPPARGQGDGSTDSASLAFQVAYGDDLFAFLEALRGEVETIDLGGGSTMDVKVPLRFPDTTVFDLFATRYAWRGVGGRDAYPVPDPEDPDPPPPPAGVPRAPGPFGTGWNATYNYAEVVVDFHAPEFNWKDSVLTSRRNRIGARVVTIPGAPYRFAPTASVAVAGLPINQDTGIVVPTEEIRLTRHWVPDMATIEAVAHALVYHTNSVAMTLGGKTWQPGCVLYGGFDSDESRGGFGGQINSRADHSFLVDDATWDKVMSDITGKFEPVVSALSSSVRIYPRADLRVLLTL